MTENGVKKEGMKSILKIFSLQGITYCLKGVEVGDYEIVLRLKDEGPAICPRFCLEAGNWHEGGKLEESISFLFPFW